MNGQLQRQHMGCGYEPQIEGARSVWQPPMGKAGHKGKALTICAGYTTKLPEVREAQMAHVHWNKGALAQWLRGDEASDELLGLIVCLEGACNSLVRWLSTPSADGGGGS